MASWQPIAVPEGRNLGTNDGGLVVYLTNGDHEDDVEVARVAFDRTNSASPDVQFFDAFMAVLDRADQAAEVVNALDADLEAAQVQATEEARQRLRELIPKAEKMS